MFKKLFLSLSICVTFAMSAFTGLAFADAYSDAYNNYVYPKATNKLMEDVPYSVNKEMTENIDIPSGNLEIKQTDLYLKGKNGLDFSLSRYYSLSGSNAYDAGVNDSGPITQPKDPRNLCYSLGSGWSWDLPYLEMKYGYINSIGGSRTLHNGSSGSSSFSYDGSNAMTSKIKIGSVNNGYNDLVMYYIVSKNNRLFTNGQENARFQLLKKDGTSYYFGIYGALLGISDRFGNNIKFMHNVKYDSLYGNYCDLAITKVIDSVGREIVFGANNITVNDPTDPSNNRTITYVMQQSGDLTYLQSVIDSQNRQTTYEYSINPAKFSFNSKNPIYGAENKYLCLTKIKYPTGGETRYSYAKFIKHLGTEGGMEFYKVFERLESKKDGNIVNYKKYNYLYNNTGEYDGYPLYPQGTQGIPLGYTMQSKVEDAVENTEIYTHKYNEVGKSIVLFNLLKEGLNHKTEIINEYDQTFKTLVSKTINKTYNKETGGYTQKVENFEYDSNWYKDKIGYWGPEAVRNSSNMPINDENKVTYKYHKFYHYLISKTYKKDASTTILEENTPLPYPDVGIFKNGFGNFEYININHPLTGEYGEAVTFKSSSVRVPKSQSAPQLIFQPSNQYVMEFDYWTSENNIPITVKISDATYGSPSMTNTATSNTTCQHYNGNLIC